jgi:hypothetical protein
MELRNLNARNMEKVLDGEAPIGYERGIRDSALYGEEIRRFHMVTLGRCVMACSVNHNCVGVNYIYRGLFYLTCVLIKAPRLPKSVTVLPPFRSYHKKQWIPFLKENYELGTAKPDAHKQKEIAVPLTPEEKKQKAKEKDEIVTAALGAAGFILPKFQQKRIDVSNQQQNELDNSN